MGEGTAARGSSAGLIPGLLLTALGCAHGPAPDRPAAPGKPEVQVGPGAMQDGDVVLASWLAYAVRRVEVYEGSQLPPANDSADDFALELAGREAQSAFWAEKRDRPHAALDQQVTIWKAGFLPEFVLLVHGRPGWTVPAKEVASFRLQEFVTRFSGDYRPGAPVVLKSASGKLVPDEPGGDFPDPQQLPIHPASCSKAIEARQAAWTRWRSSESKLGGTPVAAASPIHFGKQLLAARQDPAFAGKPITWVSLRVAHLATLDGYCAVEAKNWPLALESLQRAAAMAPAESAPRLELALTLTALARHREALLQVDRVLQTEREGCAAALAWRRRGYVLYELGALEAARTAYENSLTLEPGSQVARDELRSIAAKQKARGSASGQSKLDVPAVELIHTKCEEGRDTAAPAPAPR